MLYSIVSLNRTVSCGTMPIAARKTLLRQRAHVLPVDQDAPRHPPRRSGTAGARASTCPSRWRRPPPSSIRPRTVKSTSMQHLPAHVISKSHVLETHSRRPQAATRAHPATSAISRFCSSSMKHPVHVGQALLDLAIDHAEKVHRDVHLNHEGVDQHQIADAHPSFDDTERRAPQNQRQRRPRSDACWPAFRTFSDCCDSTAVRC